MREKGGQEVGVVFTYLFHCVPEELLFSSLKQCSTLRPRVWSRARVTSE